MYLLNIRVVLQNVKYACMSQWYVAGITGLLAHEVSPVTTMSLLLLPLKFVRL